MLGRLLNRMPSASLQRIVDNSSAGWIYGSYQHDMFRSWAPA
jgi:hypothetical protein